MKNDLLTTVGLVSFGAILGFAYEYFWERKTSKENSFKKEKFFKNFVKNEFNFTIIKKLDRTNSQLNKDLTNIGIDPNTVPFEIFWILLSRQSINGPINLKSGNTLLTYEEMMKSLEDSKSKVDHPGQEKVWKLILAKNKEWIILYDNLFEQIRTESNNKSYLYSTGFQEKDETLIDAFLRI